MATAHSISDIASRQPQGLAAQGLRRDPERRPCVSVILPVFNEARFIEATVHCLLDQSANSFDLEILVIDGESTDGTANKVSRIVQTDKRVKLLRNPQRRTPSAFNIGLGVAKGEYVCIFGAHAVYPKDYISICLAELMARGATGCSGRITTIPVDETLQARLAAWTLGHPFASSGRSVRTRSEGFVDTIPFPVMVRQALLDVGQFNEALVRNQDNDMCQRLRANGHKLFLTGKTQCSYYARSDIKALVNYAFRTGFWNAISARRNLASMAIRHFAPLFFVSILIILFAIAAISALIQKNYAAIALAGALLILGSHLCLGLLAGIQMWVRERDIRAILLPLVILVFHVAYGLGTLFGGLKGLKRAAISQV